MEASCVIFGMKHKKSKTIREKITVYKVGITWRFGGNKKKKKNTRENNGLQGWNDVAVWKDFKPQYISGDIWPQHIEHVMLMFD